MVFAPVDVKGRNQGHNFIDSLILFILPVYLVDVSLQTRRRSLQLPVVEEIVQVGMTPVERVGLSRFVDGTSSSDWNEQDKTSTSPVVSSIGRLTKELLGLRLSGKEWDGLEGTTREDVSVEEGGPSF